MPMYNLLEYSKNYRKTIGSLYNYYRDELTNDGNDNNFDNRNVINSEAFKYKNKITGNTYNVDAGAQGYDVNKNGRQNIELSIPLKYLGNFWRALNIPLISCEVFLELKWNKNCVITSLERRQVDAINNNLNILINPTFTNVNRLFVLAYRTAENRQSFSQFYLPNVMVKDFNVIIFKLPFFDLPIKTEEEAYKKIIDISRNNEYTTGNLLDYDYFKKHYKLIAIDLRFNSTN